MTKEKIRKLSSKGTLKRSTKIILKKIKGERKKKKLARAKLK